jgi:hypothetical protein
MYIVNVTTLINVTWRPLRRFRMLSNPLQSIQTPFSGISGDLLLSGDYAAIREPDCESSV